MKNRTVVLDWSIFVAVFMILIFIASQIFWSQEDIHSIIGFIREDKNMFKNIWTSFTTQWLHANVFHLLMNLIILLYLSYELRKYNSTMKNLLILTIGMIVVAIGLNVLATEGTLYIGSSGAISSLLGAFIIFSLYSNKKRERIHALEIFLTVILLSLIIPGVSIIMHFFGLFLGIILGFIFVKINYPDDI